MADLEINKKRTQETMSRENVSNSPYNLVVLTVT